MPENRPFPMPLCLHNALHVSTITLIQERCWQCQNNHQRSRSYIFLWCIIRKPDIDVWVSRIVINNMVTLRSPPKLDYVLIVHCYYDITPPIELIVMCSIVTPYHILHCNIIQVLLLHYDLIHTQECWVLDLHCDALHCDIYCVLLHYDIIHQIT